MPGVKTRGWGEQFQDQQTPAATGTVTGWVRVAPVSPAPRPGPHHNKGAAPSGLPRGQTGPPQHTKHGDEARAAASTPLRPPYRERSRTPEGTGAAPPRQHLSGCRGTPDTCAADTPHVRVLGTVTW